MVSSKKKKVLAAVLSLSMIGTMVAAVPFSASADTTTTAATPGVSYSAYVQSFAWQAAQTDGGTAGTMGKSKRVEAFKIALTNAPAGASISYQAHLQTYGWNTPVFKDGATAGTMGQSRRVEAIKVALSGLTGYSVKYRVYQQTFGWQPWQTSENGVALASAGVSGAIGHAKRVEAFQVELVKDTATQSNAPLAVSSVTNPSATTIQVAFNRAPVDSTKVVFAVKNSTGTAVTTTPTWSGAVATLTNSTNFPADTYSVAVTGDDGTALGTSSVTFSAQRVDKIIITSSKLGVNNVTSLKLGYDWVAFATYKVEDQYGNDITNSGIASGVTFQTGITDNIYVNKGVIMMYCTNDPLIYSSVVVTGYDTSTGKTTTASLATSTQIGTISNFQLGTTLTNANNATLTAGDPATTFYLSYTATDVSGNPTTNYDLIAAGLIFDSSSTPGNLMLTTSSNSYVTAKLIHDPANYNNALIQVNATTTKVSVDLPVVIYAMSYAGTTSQISITLHKQSQLNSLTLQAPSTVVAANDGTVNIPFVAQDQNGNPITKKSDFYDDNGTALVSFSSGLNLTAASDGTAVLVYTVPAQTGAQTLTASTTTGKFSTLTLNIVKNWVPDAVTVDSTKFTTLFVNHAKVAGAAGPSKETVDTGYSDGGLKVLDQYGREQDIYKSADYEVDVTGNTNAAIATATGTAAGSSDITIADAGTSGTTQLTFSVLDSTTKLDYADVSVSVSVIDPSAVKGYTMDTISSPVYILPFNATSPLNKYADHTAAYGDYNPTAKVYGTTSTSTKVVLPGGSVNSVYTSDTTKAIFDAAIANPTVNKVKVKQGALPDSNTSSASTTLTAVVNAVDGTTTSLAQTVSATSADPAAKSLSISADVYSGSGVTWDSTKETATLSIGTLKIGQAGSLFTGLTKYAASGVSNGGKFYVQPNDQYGEDAAPLFATFTFSNSKFTNGESFATTTGALTGTPFAGDSVTVTAVTTNGLSTTFTVKFVA